MKELIDIAMGRKMSRLVLKNCSIVNVFTSQIEIGDIAIDGGIIVGIGNYDGQKEIDLSGKVVCPGFIDSHMHIESTMLTPAGYAAAVMPYGTTTAIADPHEIANVCGLPGVRYMIAEAETTPMNIKFMCPSCVPATPLDNNGAKIDASSVENFIGETFGLGEFMNFAGVLSGDEDCLKKISAANNQGKTIDGHFPIEGEKELNAYALTGILTDHECISAEAATARISRGMYVQLREGTATRNVRDLLPAVNADTISNCVFCTDDKQVDDLKKRGHIDNNIRIAISGGIKPIDAVKIATINAARCYNLHDRGAIAPGRIADLVVVDNLDDFNVLKVFKRGELVAENMSPLYTCVPIYDEHVRNTMHCKHVQASDFELSLKSDLVKTIRIEPHNVITQISPHEVVLKDGKFVCGKSDKVVKIAVCERHRNTGNIGLGLMSGYNIENGAIALSVSHDSHNIIVVGDNDRDMALAVNSIIDVGGGIAVCGGGKLLEILELEIGGIMTARGADYVLKKTASLMQSAVKLAVDCSSDPFMSLSFMSLIVIPHLKITDRGLFNFDSFKFVDMEEL